MPTSATGNSARRRRRARGFTLIELLIVVAIVAVSAGLITLSLRDGSEARLEEEAVRLTALLEMARAEARVAGSVVRWVPNSADAAQAAAPITPITPTTPIAPIAPAPDADPAVHFRFIGLLASQPLPTRWLDAGTRAQVVGASTVLLGPEAILPPQRIVLRLNDRQLELASDGLGPFAVLPAVKP